jgi:hypothetical protein
MTSPPLPLAFLLPSFSKKGEHHVFNRLKSFISENHTFSQVLKIEEEHQLQQEQQFVNMTQLLQASETNGEYKVSRSGVLKPVKLLRRHTNKQSYPDGLKTCLKEYASQVLLSEPLNIQNHEHKLNHPLLSIDRANIHDNFIILDSVSRSSGGGGGVDVVGKKLLELGVTSWSDVTSHTFS